MGIGHSLYLSTDDLWDIELDSHGRIRECMGPYAIAQNAANAIKLFTEDAYYNPERGIPHFVVDLGCRLQPSIIRSRFKDAAQGVEGVAAANVQDIRLEKDGTMLCSLDLYLTDGSEVSTDVAI